MEVTNDNVRNAKTKFNDEIKIKLQLIFQCIQRILSELNDIILILSISMILPEFEYHKLEIKCAQVIEIFKQNFDEWVNKKKSNGELYGFTKNACKQQLQQQWQEEAQLLTACFDAMINYICSVCGTMQRPQLQLLFIERFILSISKMKHSFHKNSKAFPIFRGKVMVNCAALHGVIDEAHPYLFNSQWIEYRKQKVKEEKTKHGKPKKVIDSKEYHEKVVKYVECLYYERYCAIPDPLKSRISNVLYFELGFDKKHIIVCDALEASNNTNNVEILERNILEYFGSNVNNHEHIEEKLYENVSEHNTQNMNNEFRELEATLFPNGLSMHNTVYNTSPMMLSFPSFNVNHSPQFMCDINHSQCNIRINELKDDKKTLTEKMEAQNQTVRELQRYNAALMAKVEILMHQKHALENYLYKYNQQQLMYNLKYSKRRPFQSVHHFGSRVYQIHGNVESASTRDNRIDGHIDTLRNGISSVYHNTNGGQQQYSYGSTRNKGYSAGNI